MNLSPHQHWKRSIGFLTRIYKYRRIRRLSPINARQIADMHFQNWSIPDHPNRRGLTIALEATNPTAPFVLETGTSAYGTDSSRLFDLFTLNTSGQFHSVDINPKASRSLRFQHGKQSHFHVADSVEFIETSLPMITDVVDLCYLDSWDVDWSNPSSSAEHGLNEFRAVSKHLRRNSVLVIDDTPKDIWLIPEGFQSEAVEFLETFGFLPGKGSLILELLKHEKFGEVIHHEYNVVIRML